MKLLNLLSIAGILLLSCNNDDTKITNDNSTETKEKSKPSSSNRHFRGALTGGMKGDSIFFDVDAANTKISNLYFKGYWYCNGRLDMMPAGGPEGSFTLVDNKVNDHISEPPDGGSTAWRFDLNATIDGNSASGTFRMNINNLGCNTGTLKWTATAD